MFFLRRYSRFIAFPLVALMMAISMPLGVARAALVGTEQVVDPSQADTNRQRVAAFIARDDVRVELQKMGVDAAEAERRVAVMSDIEIQRIATEIDASPAGKGPAGAIIGAVVTIFIILLITDLLGLTDIFPFVKRNKSENSGS
ncbi:MAG: PA2779 family protein [Proteobacteria bacterium]|nr:PA2779 family protein [Pseudomonadota bacterium]MCK4866595.1 PA2779 family protein [Alphaproteobacteria bacterium]